MWRHNPIVRYTALTKLAYKNSNKLSEIPYLRHMIQSYLFKNELGAKWCENFTLHWIESVHKLTPVGYSKFNNLTSNKFSKIETRLLNNCCDQLSLVSNIVPSLDSFDQSWIDEYIAYIKSNRADPINYKINFVHQAHMQNHIEYMKFLETNSAVDAMRSLSNKN